MPKSEYGDYKDNNNILAKYQSSQWWQTISGQGTMGGPLPPNSQDTAQVGSGKYQKSSTTSQHQEFISQLNGALISGGTDGLGTIASMGSHFIEPQIVGPETLQSKSRLLSQVLSKNEAGE